MLCISPSVLLVIIRVSLIARLLVLVRIHDCSVVDVLMYDGLYSPRSAIEQV